MREVKGGGGERTNGREEEIVRRKEGKKQKRSEGHEGGRKKIRTAKNKEKVWGVRVRFRFVVSCRSRRLWVCNFVLLYTAQAINRSQHVFLCNLAKNQLILMPF